MTRLLPATLAGAALLVSGCPEKKGGGDGLRTVDRVIDGDTIELDGGERVRLILIDSPELDEDDCWSDEAWEHLSGLIGAAKVRLEYDVEREDHFGRTLAYVYAGDLFLNAKMVEDGAACVWRIPPNGNDFVTYFESLEEGAQAADRGLWGACSLPAPCEHSFAPAEAPGR